MAAVCWAVGRKKESLLLKATQPFRNKKHSSFAWREPQLQMQLSAAKQRGFLPAFQERTNIPCITSGLSFYLFLRSDPQARPCARVWQLQQSLALLAVPGDSAEPCKRRGGRVKGERQWLPGSALPRLPGSSL